MHVFIYLFILLPGIIKSRELIMVLNVLNCKIFSVQFRTVQCSAVHFVLVFKVWQQLQMANGTKRRMRRTRNERFDLNSGVEQRCGTFTTLSTSQTLVNFH